MSINDSDIAYQNALAAIPDALEESYERLVELGPLPLEGTAVTHALLARLSAFYEAQKKVDKLLDKRIRSASADFFVESLAFYLKVLVTTHRLDAQVSVERVLQRKRGAMRPDISLWRGDRCLACIECKTQLGWNRNRWEEQFVAREQRLLETFTGAPTFLVVLTGSNWPGFGASPQLGRKYFLLLGDAWPTSLDLSQLDRIVSTPIEGLFTQLATLIQASATGTP